MNKYQCRELADKITEAEMNEMFERAKVGVKDWTKVSRLNKSFSMGAMWNVLYGAFKECKFRYLNGIGKRNMIFEFQDFLPEHLIHAKKEKNKSEIKINHQEPKFD